jgi:Tol biopolymer transport system component
MGADEVGAMPRRPAIVPIALPMRRSLPRPLRRAAVAGAALLALGCDASEPLGPSPSIAGRILFSRTDGLTGGLFSVLPDGTDERPVTAAELATAEPHQGRTVYASGTPSPSVVCVSVVRPDGGQVFTDVCGPEIVGSAWSPSGRQFVVNMSDSLHFFALLGERPVRTRVVQGGGRGRMAWSPDGSRLAAILRPAEPAGGPGWLVTVDPGNGTMRTLANVEAFGPLAWSPDSRWIAARSQGATSQGDLRIYGANGGLAGHVVVPATLVVAAHEVKWSPDGSRLALIGNRPDLPPTELPVSASNRTDVFVAAVEGGALTRLSEREGTYFGLAWSPTGDRVAFSGTPGGSVRPERTNDVFVSTLATAPGTGGTVQLTTTAGVGETVVAWIPER